MARAVDGGPREMTGVARRRTFAIDEGVHVVAGKAVATHFGSSAAVLRRRRGAAKR